MMVEKILLLALILSIASLATADLDLSGGSSSPFQLTGDDTVYTSYTRFLVVTEGTITGTTLFYTGDGAYITDYSSNSAYIDLFQAKIDLFTSCETVTHVFKLGIKDMNPGNGSVIANGNLVDFAFTGPVRAYLTDDSAGTLTAQSVSYVPLSDPICTCEELYRDNPLYAKYVAAGRDPSCWCWQYQCHGDADNYADHPAWPPAYRVYDGDLTMLSNNWKKSTTSTPVANPCADFDHAEEEIFIEGTYSIYDGDLTILCNNWKATDDDLSDCPTYIP